MKGPEWKQLYLNHLNDDSIVFNRRPLRGYRSYHGYRAACRACWKKGSTALLDLFDVLATLHPALIDILWREGNGNRSPIDHGSLRRDGDVARFPSHRESLLPCRGSYHPRFFRIFRLIGSFDRW